MILDMHATEQTLYKGEKDYPPSHGGGIMTELSLNKNFLFQHQKLLCILFKRLPLPIG